MPVIPKILLSSTTDTLSPLAPRKSSINKIETDTVEKIALVGNSHDVLNLQDDNVPGSEKKKTFYDYLRNYFSRNKKYSVQNDIKLNNILKQGEVLQQDAESVADQLQRTGEVHPPAFSLKTKKGLLIGTALVVAGSGVGFYIRKSPMNGNANDTHANDSLSKIPSIKEKVTRSLDDTFIPVSKKQYSNITHTSAIAGESLGDNLKINRYDNNLNITKCRKRLIGYINSYIDISENVGNKELAMIMLLLMSKFPFHEARLAQIYLYGTGLYGEKEDEFISSNVQRQLVSDFLANLLYGKPLDEYLIGYFSSNRYISIEKFKREIMKNSIVSYHYPLRRHEFKSIRNLFHNRYLIPTMPILSINFQKYSQILVGSITWFLIYLSSDAEWLNLADYDEMDTIPYGIDILSYFIKGELTQVSQSRIEMGLKFLALYSDSTLNLEGLPDFKTLWNILCGELEKRIDLSSNISSVISEISTGLNNVKGNAWYSRLEFANDILKKYCGAENPRIYFYADNYPKNVYYSREPISKKEFIYSTEKQAWCIHRKNRGLSIKIPTIKPIYDKLLKDALDLAHSTNIIFIQTIFTQKDYFDPYLNHEDLRFIDKSALHIVSLIITEPRFIKERLIGPPLTKIRPNEQYIFFKALYQGEQRIYVIDSSYKKLMRRVNLETKKIKEDLSVFFLNWSSYEDGFLKVNIYENEKINISEKEPTSLFISKLIDYQDNKIKKVIKKNEDDLLSSEEEIIAFFKELFVPFYSCVKSFQGDKATDIFTNCLLDMVFLVMPAGEKIFNMANKVSGRFIDIAFMIDKSKVFKQNGNILWGKLINDFSIYNTILNEQTMLKISSFELLKNALGIFDPGVGLMNEILKMVDNTVMTIFKGELIRLSFATIKQLSTIAEFSVRAKSILDSSKKVAVKLSKPSGRLKSSNYYNSSGNVTFPPGLYGISYYIGDYYAYYSNRKEVNLLLGLTEEITEKGEPLYVMLGEDEFKGVIFQCILEGSYLQGYKITPWASLASYSKILTSSGSRDTLNGHEVTFDMDTTSSFISIISYPDYQCLFSENGVSPERLLSIFKINDIYYLFYPENKTLRPLYEGDRTDIRLTYQEESLYSIKKNDKHSLIIYADLLNNNTTPAVFNSNYSLDINSSLTKAILAQKSKELYFLSGKLFMNWDRKIFELGVTTIKNQFFVKPNKYEAPYFIVGWHSSINDIRPVKPYLKKSSSHAGSRLESFVNQNCVYGDRLKKFPTLLLSGAISSYSDIKLKILGYYYSLDFSAKGKIYLKCNGPGGVMAYKIFYDLFTESFELFPTNQPQDVSDGENISPYDKLISHIFSVRKFPKMAEIINMESKDLENELIIKLRQAAFLKRLNPIERLDTLLMPLVQVYSWELHHDTRIFQKKYPAMALWMTWQRQLNFLFDNSESFDFSNVKEVYKAYIQDVRTHKYLTYNDNFLMNNKYADYDAAWVNDDQKENYLILHRAENYFYTKPLSSDNVTMEWFPRTKMPLYPSSTQFMYEKDVHPTITVDIKNGNIIIIDPIIGEVKTERYSLDAVIEHIIMSPDGKWFVTFDNFRHALIYNLQEESLIRTVNAGDIIKVKYSTKLANDFSGDYSLLILTDAGEIYCPKGNVWFQCDGNKLLWAPPERYFPEFISQDQRFLGFHHEWKSEILLYDQKRALATLLHRPESGVVNQKINAVAFSILNAIIALSFEDGNVYLYDLVRERSGSVLNPITNIKLNTILKNNGCSNIIMRFEGVFDSLTFIHPEEIFNPNNEEKEVVYVRISYSFGETDYSD
ncbi:hypothetical protein [Klebsiella sp. BIGb0407]|uniref:hypothetical protein n=1 Tax=Klebsiella sp. BIGb0407 TaxID=2940603 RepID=UPI0021697FB3|nr:hypothetical protein [Klebsiella sp. BIGb0407]MCS3429996.1 hypothetical protein [Klebsiella sp. BIGb0407]